MLQFGSRLSAPIALAAVLLFSAANAHAAATMYLKVESDTQGLIRGSAKAMGHDGELRALAVDHQVTSPRNGRSGKRTHRPISITVAIDRGMPMLLGAWANNENLRRVELDVVGKKGKGGYSIELHNASLCGVRLVQALAGSADKDSLVLDFCYRRIIWTWQDGGITAEDDWTAPTTAKKGKSKAGFGKSGKGKK